MRREYKPETPAFAVQNIDILNVARKKNYKHSYRNGRSKHGFIYTVRGSMCDDFLDSEAGEQIVREGELIFIPKGSAYLATYLEEHTEIKIVQFDISGGELPTYLLHPVKLSVPDAEKLINAFFKPTGNQTVGNTFYYLSCLYALLWRIDELYSGLPVKYKKLRPALAEMAEHFKQNVAVSYYAELCGMSETNFRRLFTAYMGVSPIDHRNDLRLHHARISLQSGEYNVSEAAENAGFSNLSFFIRLYKKKYGITPKKE